MTEDNRPITGPTPLPSDAMAWAAFIIALVAILISFVGVVFYSTQVAA